MSSLRTVGKFVRGAVTLGLTTALAGVFAGLSGTGCGSDEGLVGGSCAEGYTQCGNRCVPLAMDPDNCGACGQACALGVECVEGVCGGEGGTAHDGGADAGQDGAATDGATGPTADGSAGDVSPEDASSEDAPSGTASDAEGTDGNTATDGTIGGDGAMPDGSEASEGGDATLTDGGDATLGTDASPDGTTEPDGASGPDGTTEPDGASEDGGEDATVSEEAGSPDAETSDAACDESQTLCGNGCVDTTSDPQNCGACNNVCASQFCQNSQCLGTSSGGLIFIGHDYEETSTGKTQSSVLSNAVFIPQANPLRVLEYEKYASRQAITQIGSILTTVATNLGRTLSITPTSTDSDIPTSLSLQTYDVLLVPDQIAAPPGTLAASGSSWAPTLAAFAQSGGVIVVLDGGTGTGEMPQFLTSAGLLDVTAQTALPTRTELDDIARGDVESVGLVTPYLSSGNTMSLTTEPNGQNVVYVIVTGGDAGGGAPVVIHKIF